MRRKALDAYLLDQKDTKTEMRTEERGYVASRGVVGRNLLAGAVLTTYHRLLGLNNRHKFHTSL